MKFSIYLSNNVIDVLECYGPINDVVNKILECGAEGLFDIMDKPTPPPKENGKQVIVDVTEPNYLALVDMYSVKSSRISLRRLLYWFVDNEVYVELGWEGVQKYKDSNAEKALTLLSNIKLYLYRLEKLTTNCDDQLSNIRNELNTMEDKIWYA